MWFVIAHLTGRETEETLLRDTQADACWTWWSHWDKQTAPFIGMFYYSLTVGTMKPKRDDGSQLIETGIEWFSGAKWRRRSITATAKTAKWMKSSLKRNIVSMLISFKAASSNPPHSGCFSSWKWNSLSRRRSSRVKYGPANRAREESRGAFESGTESEDREATVWILSEQQYKENKVVRSVTADQCKRKGELYQAFAAAATEYQCLVSSSTSCRRAWIWIC